MGWLNELFRGRPRPQSAELGRLIEAHEAKLRADRDELAQAERDIPGAMVNSENLDGGQNLRTRAKKLRSDIAEREHTLTALRSAHREALDAEDADRIARAWADTERCGDEYQAAAERLDAAIEQVVSAAVELLTNSRTFSKTAPVRIDSTDPPLPRLVQDALFAMSDGMLGRSDGLSSAAQMRASGRASIAACVRNRIAVALRNRTPQPETTQENEIHGTDASVTT